MKNIRSKFVKESLLDYENLANSLKENTTSAVKDLLSEEVRNTYNKILTEAEDDDDEDSYEVDEVNDTESEKTDNAEEQEDDSDDTNSDDDNSEDEVDDEENSETDEDTESEDDLDSESSDEESEVSSEEAPEEDEWAEFDKYKVSDDEYDLSDAKDDEIVKVYKLLKDDDQVLVNVDNDAKQVELKDNQTGAEYLLDLSSFDSGNDTLEEEPENNDEADGELDYEDENMDESRIYEVVLNEYDSNVGYTDSYQKKDVMTTPGNNEPGKNVNDWDAGVPKGSSKPWVGKGNSKPFDKNVSEEDEIGEVEPMEENVTTSNCKKNLVTKILQPSSRKFYTDVRNLHDTNKQVTNTAKEKLGESKMMSKVNKILKENEELKKALGKFKNVLQEAAVTNVNLGQIIKLISENSTTKDEKQEIIERFGKEAKTVEQSKSLYESISRELKKNSKMDINEEKQFTANGSKMINEKQIYQSKDLMESLDLMHRLCK